MINSYLSLIPGNIFVSIDAYVLSICQENSLVYVTQYASLLGLAVR